MLKITVLIIMTVFTTPQTQAKECVILLHGLARSESSMSKLAESLSNSGYAVVNQGYDSTQHNIESLAMSVVPQALNQCITCKKVHFVTHSMGGILLRYYTQYNDIENLGRVVMLGPPNKGSEVVDHLKNVPGFKWMNGPAGMQLGTHTESVPNSLGPVTFDLGVIAGTRSMNLILSNYLPNPDDGKVSVESTKVEGMNDHISLPVTHTFMMRNKQVIEQVTYYLVHGFFCKV